MIQAQEIDVAVIGAGIAGLVCAQRLQQSGFRTVVMEKSRGVGGRLATRRVQADRVDHGAVYLTPQDSLFQEFVRYLLDRQIMHVWTDRIHQLDHTGFLQPLEPKARYVARDGMTAIAKFLASGLEIRCNQRVTQLERQSDQWQILVEPTASSSAIAPVIAKAMVVAVPAPQAVELFNLNDLPTPLISTLQSISYLPCLSTIAGYSQDSATRWLQQFPDVRAIQLSRDPMLAWVGLDSSKRSSQSTILVLQSTPDFARQYLEATDLSVAADRMVQHLSNHLGLWLSTPDWLQIHRWRYAFPENALSDQVLTGETNPPLLLTGDWCAGNRAEQAFLSGLAAAERMGQLLNKNAIAPETVWESIAFQKT